MSTTNRRFERLAVNRGASLLVKLIALGAMLVASHVSIADAELDRMKEEISKEAYVEVTTTHDVQQQINKLQLADKNRAEAAIKVGAAYVKVYLHGLYSCEVSDYWDAFMGGLTATDDAWDWSGSFCGGKNGFQNQAIQPMACSPVTLVALQLKDGGVTLEYRITRMGGVTWSKGPNEFSPKGAGETRRFNVSINADNRIYDIDPRGDPTDIGYVSIVEEARTYLKDPTFIGLRTPAEQKAGKVRLRQLIQQIEQQAAQVCK